jgi:hypothetical protein
MAKKCNKLKLAAKAQHSQYWIKSGNEGWFAKLRKKNTSTADELMEIAIEWSKGGEIRDLLPTKTSFYRFAIDKIPDIKRVTYNAFRTWLDDVV